MMARPPGHVEGIEPYVPGKPIEELERELGLKNSIKLASNENPLGPSPAAIEAFRSASERLHRYPDGGGFHLREKLARHHRVPMEQIVLGNGSTELIELFARTFLGTDGWAVMSDQAFMMYRIAVMAVNGLARTVPLHRMRHDLGAMAAVAGGVKLAYIANPNNPTGTYVGAAELDAFVAQMPAEAIIVLDEAYRDFVEEGDYPDGVRYVREGRPVAVLRTFSKIHGLAALRIGYAITGEETAASIEKVRSPFNTSHPAQAAACAALDDAAHVQRSRDANRVERAFVAAEFTRRGWAFTPSVANFHLLDIGRPAAPIYDRLLRDGVIVRPMTAYNFPTSLRVTIGTREENLRFLEALDRALGRAGGGGAARA
ncbi:MAG: histidinol-phosphate transaminase [Acidobacteria bacterium]|nr:histidinol-phosphate transaminase [Acidobacteriota bacterium]